MHRCFKIVDPVLYEPLVFEDKAQLKNPMTSEICGEDTTFQIELNPLLELGGVKKPLETCSGGKDSTDVGAYIGKGFEIIIAHTFSHIRVRLEILGAVEP